MSGASIVLLMQLTVLGTSLWMGFEARSFHYDKRDVKGLGAIDWWAWLVCGLVLWIVAFPLYLVKRGTLKRAGQMRREVLESAMLGAPLTGEQVAAGVADLARRRDAGQLTDEACRLAQAALIARRR